MADEENAPEGVPTEMTTGDSSGTAPASTRPTGSGAAGTGNETKPSSDRSGGVLAGPRRFLALLVVVVAVGGFFVARANDGFESCETKVTQTSTAKSKVERTETCKPLPVETMVPALLLVLALMWPDLTSVELFGLGRITRQLKQQDTRQDELEASQQHLENSIQNINAVQQSPTINNFATDPAAAHMTEMAVDAEREDDAYAHLLTAAGPLKPWLNVARRMNGPKFAEAVRAGAASGALAGHPSLQPPDVELLRQVQRPGRPFAVDELERWAEENAVQLDAVRDTLAIGTDANAESVRVATRFAEQLLSDLRRRGLLATE